MLKVDPILNNFNSGELSPKLDARSDLQKYLTGCRVLENFIPLVEGGAQARPGTYYVTGVKNHNKATRLFPFQFSTSQAYIIEAGEYYFRFYKNGGQIVASYAAWAGVGTVYALGALVTNGGSYYRCIVAHTAAAAFATDLAAGYWEVTGGATDIAYEIPSPYAAVDLFGIKLTQSADIMYLAHRSHALRKLSRTGDTVWTLTNFVAALGGNLVITGATQTNPCVITATGEDADFPAAADIIYIAGAGGMTQINDKFFTAALVELMPNQVDRDFSAASAWANVDLNAYNETGDLTITSSVLAQYCTCPVASAPTTIGKRYRLKFDAANIVESWEIRSFDGTQILGTVTTRGAKSFDFLASTTGGYRIVSLAAISSGDFDNFSLTELGTFQLSGINSTAYTAYTSGGTAQKCQFGTTGNNPGAIAFFEQRFMAGGTNNDPLDIFGSASADFENFTQDAADASSALQYSLLSDKVDAVRWMLGEDYLLIGTQGGLWRMGASSSQDPLTIDNVVAKRQISTGCMDADAEMVADAVIFVQKGGTTVRRTQWEFEREKYLGQDITRIAKHITKGNSLANSGIEDMDYQSEPFSILWAVRADGTLIGMTYEPTENVFAWFRIVTDGLFESVAVITNDGEEDQVWVIVNRTIGGSTKRYVEYFKPHEFFNVYKDAFFVDSGLTWNGGAAKTITAITNANPAVVTATAHGFSNGWKVRITGVVGMTQVNQGLTTAYTVANKTADTFELQGITSVGWGVYTSGGTVQRVANNVSGLTHLAAESVAVLTNHGKHPAVLVSAGGVATLTWYANVITVGLSYNYNLQPLKFEPGTQEGTSRSRKKRIYALSCAFYESGGAKWGPDADNLRDVPFGLGAPPDLFTDDKETDFDADFDTGASVYIRGSSPLPLTVLSASPKMVVVDVG